MFIYFCKNTFTVGDLFLKIQQIKKGIMILAVSVHSNIIGYSCSYDNNFTKYYTNVKFMNKSKKILDRNELSEIVLHCINKFEQINKIEPERILIYRSSVAETEIQKMYETEINDIDKKCVKISV